jgi:AraC-like DNA-binding protein
MSSQVTIFFLVFGGLQGILFTSFLIRKKLYRSGHIFLLLYFAVMLLQITLKLMSKGWLIDNWKVLYELSYQLPFLYGPFIYFFTSQLIQRRSFQSVDLLHFAPFGILVFFFVLGYSYRESPIVLFPFLLAKFRLLLQLVSLYLYHWFAFQCLKSHSHYIDRFYSSHQFSWLKRFIFTSFLVCGAVAVLNYFMVVLYPELNYVRPGFLVLTLFIYWITYEALHHPEVFSVVKGYGDGDKTALENLPKLTVHRPTKKYLRSNLTEEEGTRIMNNLNAVMQQKKPYLDPGLNIDGLAVIVDSNRHHVSQVLNDKLKKSFYDYINSYRVEEAKTLLTDPVTASHKIASIAYDSGFNSLSTFNDVFRKCTGNTPSQFRKRAEEVSRKKRV